MKVLITGAFGGIGSSLARAFAVRGDSLILLDRVIPSDEDELIGRPAMLAAGAREVISHAVDFRHPATLDDLLSEMAQGGSRGHCPKLRWHTECNFSRESAARRMDQRD